VRRLTSLYGPRTGQQCLEGIEPPDGKLPPRVVSQDPSTLGIPPARRRGRILATLADVAPAGLCKNRLAALAGLGPHTMIEDLRVLAARKLIRQLSDGSWALV